jgi:hypothetical protein
LSTRPADVFFTQQMKLRLFDSVWPIEVRFSDRRKIVPSPFDQVTVSGSRMFLAGAILAGLNGQSRGRSLRPPFGRLVPLLLGLSHHPRDLETCDVGDKSASPRLRTFTSIMYIVCVEQRSLIADNAALTAADSVQL